ncbi:hypothetical protein CRG98_016535 [Punica granatum]|uniref:Uncharacterized protein n=1 Tax=Punica granatum TaxID=22663 RepID=A0A2I0K3G3_PUNGR|nr:hypothetical protein CRG98_016535 [Punica granatum]
MHELVCHDEKWLGSGRERLPWPWLSHGIHGLVSREEPVSSLGLPGARAVSLFPNRVDSYVPLPLITRAIRNDVKDPPKLESGQGVFGHSSLRGGRIIRDLLGVSVGPSIIPKSILGIVRNYASF